MDVKCLIRDYHYEKSTGVIRVDDKITNKANIIFNKSFYAPMIFLNELTKLLNENLYMKKIASGNMKDTEDKVNYLLEHYDSMNALFLEDPKTPTAYFEADKFFNLY